MREAVDKIKNIDEADILSVKVFIEALLGNAQSDIAEVEQRLLALTEMIDTDKKLQSILQAKCLILITRYDWFYFFSQSTFLEEKGLLSGIWRRMKNRLLPKLHNEKDIVFLFGQLLGNQKQLFVLKKVDQSVVAALWHAIDFKGVNPSSTSKIYDQLQKSMLSLSTKISGFGMDYEIKSKLTRLELDAICFYNLQKNMIAYLEQPSNTKLERANADLDQIKQHVVSLRKRKNEIGTTLELTYASNILLNYIFRLQELLKLYRQNEDLPNQWWLVLLNNWEYNAQKNKIGKYISAHTDLLALEIVEHTASKGEKYIANNIAEYWYFLRASMLGGFLIAIFAAFKIYLDGFEVNLLTQSLLFSINYALCFVLVKSFGGMIATKQPAMTASTISKLVDKNDDLKIDGFKQIVYLVQRVSVSQLISFVGNLVIAFPLAIAIPWIAEHGFGYQLIGEYKVTALSRDLEPLVSGSVFYAMIAGVFLSLAGLISGYFDNKMLASNMRIRISNHPILTAIFPRKIINNIAGYLEKNAGALSGNISLGFLLGTIGLLSYFTGIPLDIRHIAFSSANLGFIVSSASISTSTILMGALTVILIGLFNFLISFGITLMLTLKSRSITLSQFGKLSFEILKTFLRNPFPFIFPNFKKN